MFSLAACEKSAVTAPPSTIFLVTAFATPQVLKAGETTNIIIGITNVSDTTATFDANFCGPSFRVDNTGVYGSPSGCFANGIIERLASGEQTVYTGTWTTLAVDSTGNSVGPLPAGAYTVRGAALGDVSASKVTSVPFTVQLTP
ncbi:MAG TPA: hypothetical protein VGQ30_08380 [Gemmatimonadaceae bacterium]|nr:hypothetical protein [Gemmatimonadaceae bacterium]